MNKNLLPAFIALFALLISQPVSAQTPEATNVKIQTLGNRIRITYELTGASKYHRLSVRPLLVMPDSSINADAIKSATGIGPIPSINGPQFIEWDWSKDLPALPPGFDIRIKIVKELRVPNAHAVSYSGTTLAPYGLKYAFLGRHGFYLSAKTLNFGSEKARGTYADLQSGFLQPATPYQFTDAILQSRALTAGYSRILTPFLHGYAGLGVGIDRTLWEVQVLDGDLEPAGATFWVEPTESDAAGKLQLVYEIGANLVFKRILLDVGVGMINNEQVFLNFGVGYLIWQSATGF